MNDGGRLIPDGLEEALVAQVRKVRSFAYMSEEMLVDAGYEPPPGYWERQLARDIATRRVRARLRWFRYRLLHYTTAGNRLIHAIAALRGDDTNCPRQDD